MESIGKYQIVEKIGEGGFGIIYKGYDPFIKRAVAVKTCTSDAEDIRSRFFHEAQIAGNLQHRNITTVYDFGVLDGVPYLVQEYLSGEDLDRKVKRKEFLPYPEKLLYLVQIARGLEFAHSRGVIHRDIKPANIRILEDGTTKIMDFGIAKLAQQESGLTQTGMTLGTAAYLAPEQIRGESVDQRTDIFSYGLLAYELLTYVRPFSGQQISTLLYQILNEFPKPLAERWPTCPPELQALVERCMAKEPNDRYPSMTEVLRDLEALLKRRRAIDELGGESREEPGHDTNPMAVAEMATTTLPRNEPPTSLRPLDPAALRNDANRRGPGPSDPNRRSGPPSSPGSERATTTRTIPIADIGELELAYHVDEHRKTPRSITTTAYARRQRSPWPWLGAVAAALIGGIAVWVATRGGASSSPVAPPDPPPAATAASLPVAVPPTSQPATQLAAAGGSGDPAPGGPAAATPTGETAAAAPAGTIATPPAAGSGTTTGSATPAAGQEKPAETAPEVPAAPPKASLELLPGWSDRIVVHGLGRALPLGNKKRTLELEPGTYKLMFELLTDDFSDVEELRVTVKAGETRRIQSPLRRPGQLSVLPFRDTPQGMVLRNGETMGMTPLFNRRLRPGSYTLEIRAAGSASQGLSVPVTIESDAITTVNFDLTGRRPTSSFARPLGGAAP